MDKSYFATKPAKHALAFLEKSVKSKQSVFKSRRPLNGARSQEQNKRIRWWVLSPPSSSPSPPSTTTAARGAPPPSPPPPPTPAAVTTSSSSSSQTSSSTLPPPFSLKISLVRGKTRETYTGEIQVLLWKFDSKGFHVLRWAQIFPPNPFFFMVRKMAAGLSGLKSRHNNESSNG